MHAVRDGRLPAAQALVQLRAWQGPPGDAAVRRRLASDRVVWSQAAGESAQAAGAAREAPVEQLADYALEPAFHAARAVGDRALADAALRSLRQRAPTAWTLRRLEILLLAEEAGAAAASLQAEALVQAHPGAFGPLERAGLRQAALGQRLRWAIVERDQQVAAGPARFGALDALLPQFEAELAAATLEEAKNDASAADWRALRHRLAWDQLEALFARGRFAEVTQRFEVLRREPGIALPYYALSTAAGAYQQQRRSDLAVPLYEAALRAGAEAVPLPSDIHVGLVYAYLDTARFDEAEALLLRLEAATPPLLRLTPEQGRPNPEYTEVRNLRALAQLYTDHPAQAERSFDALVALAPLNVGFRSGQAETARLRSRPEAALARYEETLTDHPHDLSARAGQALALFDAGELRAGRERVDALAAEAPESTAVRNAVRQRDATMAARLDVEAGYATDGGALASREWRVDSRLSSPWLHDSWRLFYRQVFAAADTDAGAVGLARSGLGVEWLRGPWNLTGELHSSQRDAPRREGLAVGVKYRASDSWRLSVAFDTNSLETPWKARRAGIAARSAELGATYLANESRSIEGSYRRMDFSDGNLRQGLGLNWRERWISGPRFQLESTLGAETARSERQDGPYFSPARETAAEAGLRASYLSWKRDDRRLVQVVEASAGRYAQQGFGGGALWSLQYAHEWDIGPALRLRYGLGVSSHPYDGVRERRRFAFLTLSMPLP